MTSEAMADQTGEQLKKLCACRSGTDGRALRDEIARINLGFDTLAEVQRRNALSDEDATDRAVRAVREVRAERR